MRHDETAVSFIKVYVDVHDGLHSHVGGWSPFFYHCLPPIIPALLPENINMP